MPLKISFFLRSDTINHKQQLIIKRKNLGASFDERLRDEEELTIAFTHSTVRVNPIQLKFFGQDEFCHAITTKW